jgi:RES domain-containing protein
VFVYRITTAKWAGILSGSGYPARWNSKGVFVIYTASNRALACLENLVHRSGEGLHGVFKITEIEIPDSASITTITDTELPTGWHRPENYNLCREIGDRWIQEGNSLLLSVPSAIIRDESNLLINPNHAEFTRVNVNEVTAFEFDRRL